MKHTLRAWRALKEALKIDVSNWRLWDNYMRVSTDLKEYGEVCISNVTAHMSHMVENQMTKLETCNEF